MSSNHELIGHHKRVYLTRQENEHLTELCLEHIDKIKTKATDNKSRREKQQAWETICERFNSLSSSNVDVSKLKKAWENVQTRAKKRGVDINLNRKSTRAPPNYLLRVVDSMAEDHAPLPCPYDSDAGHHSLEINAQELEMADGSSEKTAELKRPRAVNRISEMRELEHISFMEYMELKKEKTKLEIEQLKKKSPSKTINALSYAIYEN